jgi:hypothetical protein
MADQFERITVTLTWLRQRDTDDVVFGSHSHQSQLGACLTEDHRRAVEAGHQITLPADSRQFLQTMGNGGAWPSCGAL